MKQSTNRRSVKKTTTKKSKAKFSVRHPFVMPVAIFFGIVISLLWGLITFNSTTIGASDSHIVDVYVDGVQQTVPTRANDIKTLLERLKITLNEGDIVEPAIETPIIEDNTQVNIYRARPIQVVEGNQIKVVLSASRSPRQLATQAGLQLLAEDGVEIVQNDNLAKGDLIAEQVIVSRSVPVEMSVFGVLGSYRTRAKTVGDLLIEKSIQLKDNESVQPADLNSPITANMFISVNLPGRQTVAIQEEISYKTTTKNDSSVKAGETKISQAGQKGLKAVIYEVEIKDGVEVSRKLLQEVVLREPVQEIKLKGTQAIATYAIAGDKADIFRAAGVAEKDFAAIDYIFQKESTWRPGAINSRGCIGLGQRCPSGGSNALANACPNWQTDAVCQVRHFSGYASRYGGWQGAYSAWLEQGWW